MKSLCFPFYWQVRSIESLAKWEWLFMVISLVALCTSLGFNIQRLVTLRKSIDDFTFAILLLVTTGKYFSLTMNVFTSFSSSHFKTWFEIWTISVFCFYYIARGIYQECLYEILVFLSTVVIVIIYCIENYAVGKRNNIKLVSFWIILLFFFLQLYLTI